MQSPNSPSRSSRLRVPHFRSEYHAKARRTRSFKGSLVIQFQPSSIFPKPTITLHGSNLQNPTLHSTSFILPLSLSSPSRSSRLRVPDLLVLVKKRKNPRNHRGFQGFQRIGPAGFEPTTSTTPRKATTPRTPRKTQEIRRTVPVIAPMVAPARPV